MTKLETKVAARNEVNRIALAYTAKCRLALYSLIGKKIILASGSNSAKFLAAVRAIGMPIGCFISTGHGYSVTANFRVRKTTEAGTFYAEALLYLYDIKNGVMVANPTYKNPIYSYRTDFNAADILRARLEFTLAKAALQTAERALCNFGGYDN